MLQTRLGLVIKLLSIILIPGAIGRRRNETVHASIVCMGNCLKIVTPLLNSLLYKHNRLIPIEKPRYHYTIHFHILVDDSTATGTIELCSAMKSNAMCTIYNENHRLPGLGWLTNLHYAGAFDFIKLFLPEILHDLDKVIVIDYDLVFMCDIIELWDVFKKMGKKQIFGLVEEHTDWYINGLHGLGNVIGVGFNLGVWLWDLKKTSKIINWARTWQDHVNATQPVRNAIELGAQDVINGIVKKNPDLLYKMDCRFNVQLTGVSTAKRVCYGDISNIKVIHYNTRSKIISNKTADYNYFNTIRDLFS